MCFKFGVALKLVRTTKIREKTLLTNMSRKNKNQATNTNYSWWWLVQMQCGVLFRD